MVKKKIVKSKSPKGKGRSKGRNNSDSYESKGSVNRAKGAKGKGKSKARSFSDAYDSKGSGKTRRSSSLGARYESKGASRGKGSAIATYSKGGKKGKSWRAEYYSSGDSYYPRYSAGKGGKSRSWSPPRSRAHDKGRDGRGKGGGRTDDLSGPLSMEDKQMMKKITVVAQLGKVPNPIPAMEANGANGANGNRKREGRGSLSSRFGANFNR
jgi:hypothetical protein